MSPTTTSSQRLMSNTHRSPKASSRSLMTSTTMTSPSVRRSFMRAEDEPITLKKKACRPVCRRQSVVIERRNLLFADLCRALKKLRDITLIMNRLRLSWSDKESRFSLTAKQRFENTNSKPTTTEEVFKIEWNDRVATRRNLSCSSRRRTKPTRSTASSWTVIEAKMGSPWSLIRKVSMKWKNWSDFKVQHSTPLRGENWSKIEHYPWTHGQNSGITEWSLLSEWFEIFWRCRVSTQWTIPRSQSTNVISILSWSRRIAKPFSGTAEPQQWAAKYLGHA